MKIAKKKRKGNFEKKQGVLFCALPLTFTNDWYKFCCMFDFLNQLKVLFLDFSFQISDLEVHALLSILNETVVIPNGCRHILLTKISLAYPDILGISKLV